MLGRCLVTREQFVGGLWEVAFFVGAVVLLAALVWGVMAYNRRNRANQPVTEQATSELYANSDTYGDKEDDLRRRTS